MILLAYAAISNDTQCIHIEQLKFIDRLLKRDKAIRERIYAILTEKEAQTEEENKRLAIEALYKEDHSTILRFRKNLLYLLCLDGDFDTTESDFFLKIFPDYIPDSTEIECFLKKFRRKLEGTPIRRFVMRLLYVLQIWWRNHFYRSVDNESEHNSPFIAADMLQRYISNLKNQVSQLSYSADLSIKDTLRKTPVKQDITVTLVGRTKAGKSTLFYLLSGYGLELIGKGAQRTTRFAIAAHTQGIRLIDTPGLDAAANGGRQDEEKTLRMIQLADFVCFVMTEDSGKPSDFIQQIAIANKPMCVLVNHKGTFSKAEWRSIEQKGSLQECTKPLQSLAEKEHWDHILRFFHIYGLAIRPDEKWSRWKRNQLVKKSNVFQAIDFVFKSAREKYPLYRASSLFWQVYSSYTHTLNSIHIQQISFGEKIQCCNGEKESLRSEIAEVQRNVKNIIPGIWSDFSIEVQGEALHMNNKDFEQTVNEYAQRAYNKIWAEFAKIVSQIAPNFSITQSEQTTGNGDFVSDGVFHSITGREIIDAFQKLTTLLRLVPTPLGLAADIGSGFLNLAKITFPSEPQRRAQLAKLRKEEIEKYAKQLEQDSSKQIEESLKSLWKNVFDRESQKIDTEIKRCQESLSWLERQENETIMNQNTLRDDYAAFFLKYRQPDAELILATINGGLDTPRLLINASFSQPENWTETLLKVSIQGGAGND